MARELAQIEKEMRETLARVASAIPKMTTSSKSYTYRDGTVDTALYVGPIDGAALVAMLREIESAITIPFECNLQIAFDAGRRTEVRDGIRSAWRADERARAFDAARAATRFRHAKSAVHVTILLTASASGLPPTRNLGRASPGRRRSG